MMSRFWALLLAAACGAAAATGTTKGTARDKPEPAPVFDKKYLSSAKAIKAGKEVWEAQCRHCHGAAAYPGKAPKLNPGMLEPDFIFDRVTYGFGKMPAWKEVFSLEQRKSVVAYVKSREFSP
jgi:mono/diheme cytochrome c family protein